MTTNGACRPLLAFFLLVAGVPASADQRVLFFSDFASITPGYRAMENGIADVLGDKFQHFYPEFLNSRELSNDEIRMAAIVDLYAEKYASTGIDIIVSYGPQSDLIARRVRDHFDDARILRIMLSQPTYDLGPQDAELSLEADLFQIYSSIFAMSDPNTILFTGETTGQSWRQGEVDLFWDAVEAYGFDGELVDMLNVPLSEVERRASTLPKDAIVVSLLWFSDSEGRPLYPYQAIDRLIASASAPVFTLLSEHVARGTPGGLVVSREMMGMGIGRALLDMENNTQPPRTMPVMRHVYNWTALQKWGLTPSSFPSDAVVLNTPPLIWNTYRRQLIATIIIGVLLLNALGLSLLLARQRARSKKVLERSLDQLDVARKAAKIGFYRRTYGVDEMFCDERFRELFGLPLDGPVTVDEANSRIHADDLPTVIEETRRCRDPAYDYTEYEAEFRIDRGPMLPPRWVHARGEVHFKDDAAETFTGAVYDVTDYREAAKTRDILIQELNHRVKNTLSVVQGLAFQTFHGADDIERAFDTFHARLAGLSAAHDLLAAASWEEADIQEVVRQTLRGAENISISGPAVRLPPKLALSISMALHELQTNAIKYGALSKPAGRVELSWSKTRKDGVKTLHLSWNEIGGPPAREPKTQGFGMVLVSKIVPKDNAGTADLAFTKTGFRYDLTVPILVEENIVRPKTKRRVRVPS